MSVEASLDMLSAESRAFLQDYLATLLASELSAVMSCTVVADYFCADKENADLCAALVLAGEKRATCGLAHFYDTGETPEVAKGDLLIVLDWDRNPVSIVRFSQIERVRFADIDATFAFEEGEGDKSYDWWRKTHWDFFSRELTALGKEMSDEMIVVTERFEKVWPV